MKFNKPLIAILAISVALSACSGSSSKKKNPDIASCPEESFVTDGSAPDTRVLEGTICKDFTLTADTQWQLKGYVLVGSGSQTITSASAAETIKANGVTLTIEPGTDVRGLAGSALVVTRGSKIEANGTAAKPITFSSAQDDNYDGEAEWGGVVVQGFAPQYTNAGICGDQETTFCNVEGEGGVGVYGGGDIDDNSGTIRYVRIAEGGLVVGQGNEINGLTLQGVGYGTTIEYVQVHNNRDDGVEWFGGAADARYLVLTNNDDDDVDFDEGYTGNIQYVLIRKNPSKTAASGSNDPRAIEANSSGADSVKETEAVIANVTIIGSDLVTTGTPQPAMRLRGDVKVNIHNSAVEVYDECYEIDTGDEGTTATGTTVVLNNFLGDCTGDAVDVEDSFHLTTTNHDLSLDLTLDAAYALENTEADLGSATVISEVGNGSPFTFDDTDYIGAVEPGTSAANAWWAGWTIDGSL